MKLRAGRVCVLAGALLVLVPVLGSQWRLSRVESFYEQRGEGSQLPNELKARPFGAYDWSCLGLGMVLIAAGVSSRRSDGTGGC